MERQGGTRTYYSKRQPIRKEIMPFIQNTSLKNIRTGNHLDPGQNCILIQISDPPGNFPKPRHVFKEIFQFDFLDLDEKNLCSENPLSEFLITQNQADDLVGALKKALDKNMNVIVHCHAGVCRSGAVAEVGVMMGFEDTGSHRIPNIPVKKMMMRSLGWTYDSPKP